MCVALFKAEGKTGLESNDGGPPRSDVCVSFVFRLHSHRSSLCFRRPPSVAGVYRQMLAIVRLPSIRLLAVCFLVCRIGFIGLPVFLHVFLHVFVVVVVR